MDDSNERKFQKELNGGLVGLVLLAVLAETNEDLYGYEIAKRLASANDGTSIFKEGTIYPVLRALSAGEPVDEIVDRLVLPLVEKAVPEWQATLDALLSLPEIGGPVGYTGGVIAIGIRLAVVEPRISAAVFFAGSFVPAALFEEARQVTIPLQVLLQWDDEGNDRQSALDLFDAFGSSEKTLHANLGGHTGVPQFEVDDGARFFARHLS